MNMMGSILMQLKLVALLQLGDGATLHKERGSGAVTGTLIRRASFSHQRSATSSSIRKKQRNDLCGDNYIQGEGNHSNCSASYANGAARQDIEDPLECEEAAREKCPQTEDCLGKPFIIESKYYNHYPMRCFMTVYGHWHFNPVGYIPNRLMHAPGHGENATALSFPICQQIEYHNGTLSAGEAHCPADYQVIIHEDACRSAQTCLSLCAKEQFRVFLETIDAATTQPPRGCHISLVDGCVRFNSNSHVKGKPVVGTPLCNLTIPRGSEDDPANRTTGLVVRAKTQETLWEHILQDTDAVVNDTETAVDDADNATDSGLDDAKNDV
jgi:hypothetical protein